MNFTDHTTNKKICGIIGYPLAHSLSLPMHNAAFKELGLDFEYFAFETPEHELSTKLEKLKTEGIMGLNITMPYKTEILAYLDDLDELAREIGAVNTIVNLDGTMTGYNTDSYGAVEALTRNGVDVQKNKYQILVLGAGGSARAVAFPLSKLGHNITISNRTIGSGERLANELSTYAPSEFLGLDEIQNVIDKIDLIINCTSVGMKGNEGQSLIPAELIHEGQLVFDIVYSHMQTQLLKNAEAQGASVIYGYEMLIYQGAGSFELWTGEQAPIDVMRAVVINELEDKK